MAHNAVIPFDFNSRPIRVVTRDGDPWFVAADVADALGYQHAPHAVRILANGQKGVHNLDTLGGAQTVTIINESGLYRLILRSRKPEAAKFSDWVTGEVLPTIRKTGTYNATGARPALPSPAEQVTATMAAARAYMKAERWILSFDDNMQPKLAPLEGDAMVVFPCHQEDVLDFIREIPVELLPKALQLGAWRALGHTSKPKPGFRV